MLDLVSIGEALIDFTPQGTNEQGNPVFVANPGGGPANLAVAAARLGTKTAFMGQVGDDQFGQQLRQTLEKEGIDTSGLILTQETHTSLAFVQLEENGDRDFIFFRNPGADELYNTEDVRTDTIDRARCLHFSSVTLTHPISREATLFTAKYAKEHGKIVSFDPNWRPLLWADKAEGIRQMQAGAALAEIVKATPDELTLLTGSADRQSAVKQLQAAGVSIVILTEGKRGCTVYTKTEHVTSSVVPVTVRDTTGAGDSFFGAFLHKLLEMGPLDLLQMNAWKELADYANAAASYSVERYGAIPAMPTQENLRTFMKMWGLE